MREVAEETIHETIVAIATPMGRAGIGIVRLSGPRALAIAEDITHHTSLQARKAYFSCFYDDSEIIDEGVCIYFKAPHSFTGEDIIELQGHGAPIVLDRLLNICIRYGARLAKPGEFSLRAFLNNKMDLTQAEAVADLIHAQSESAARLAMHSLQGAFSEKIRALGEKIIHIRLFIEASIDFSDEDIDFMEQGKIKELLQNVLEDLNTIRTTATSGAILRDGLTVVIAGPPNAGKSTLMNQLAGREVAIVTSVPGTTRDVMREHILIDDIPFQFLDTAGLRETEDIVEKEGVARAMHELKRADCLLFVVDFNAAEEVLQKLQEEVLQDIPSNIPMLYVFNKIDCYDLSASQDEKSVHLSAKTGEGISLLKEKIKSLVGYVAHEGQFLARRRHLDALDKAYKLIHEGYQQLNQHRAIELLADDLRYAHQSLMEITGDFSSDDLLGKIFSSFCIGK